VDARRRHLGRGMEFSVADGPPPERGAPLYRSEFPGLPDEKNRVIAEVMALLLAEPIDASDQFRLRLCLDEAIQNAISHGNEDDPGKTVSVSVFEAEGSWELMVRDQGHGFSPRAVPDPRETPGLEGEGGRGLLILKEYMDGLKYFDGGRTLVLTKRKRREVPSSS